MYKRNYIDVIKIMLCSNYLGGFSVNMLASRYDYLFGKFKPFIQAFGTCMQL